MEASSIQTVTELSTSLSAMFIPLLAAVMTVLIGMAIKDGANAIAKGLMFRFQNVFSEGDIVFLNGERALIVKIGIMQSVFGITKPDGTYVWRYINNTKIDNIVLEKILNITFMKLPTRPDGQDIDNATMSNAPTEEKNESK